MTVTPNTDKIEKPKQTSLLEKFNIPVDHLSYEYVEKCEDGRELERILRILRSGEEGSYPQLVAHTECQLSKVRPESKMLRKQEAALEPAALEPGQWKEIKSEIQTWTADVNAVDKDLSQVVKTGALFEVNAPVRCSGVDGIKAIDFDENIAKPQADCSGMKNAKPPRSYAYWDKYNPDQQLLEMSLEEEREKETAEIRKREKSNKVAVPKYDDASISAERLTPQERKSAALAQKQMGNEWFNAGDLERAAHHYATSIALHRTAAALNNRALTLFRRGLFNECVTDCDDALGLEPDSVKALYRRACAHERLGDLLDAHRDAVEVCRLDPGNKPASGMVRRLEGEMVKGQAENKGRRMQITEISDDSNTCKSRNQGAATTAGKTNVTKPRAKIVEVSDVKAETSKEYLNPCPGTSKEYLNPRPGTSKEYLNPRPGTSKEYINPRPGTSKEYINPRPGTSQDYLNARPGTSKEWSNQGSFSEQFRSFLGNSKEQFARGLNTDERNVKKPRPKIIELSSEKTESGANQKKGGPKIIELSSEKTESGANRKKGGPKIIELSSEKTESSANQKKGGPKIIELSIETTESSANQKKDGPKIIELSSKTTELGANQKKGGPKIIELSSEKTESGANRKKGGPKIVELSSESAELIAQRIGVGSKIIDTSDTVKKSVERTKVGPGGDVVETSVCLKTEKVASTVTKDSSSKDSKKYKSFCQDISVSGEEGSLGNKGTSMAGDGDPSVAVTGIKAMTTESRVAETPGHRIMPKDVSVVASERGSDGKTEESEREKEVIEKKEGETAFRQPLVKEKDAKNAGGADAPQHDNMFFLHAWTTLQHDADMSQHAKLLNSIKPEDLPKAVGPSLDQKMLSQLLGCLDRQAYLYTPDMRLDYLANVTRLQRFNIVACFMGNDDFDALGRIFDLLFEQGTPVPDELIASFNQQ